MTFKKGDIVIVNPDIKTPRFGWGTVQSGDVGLYLGCDDSPNAMAGEVLVVFPRHDCWHCMSYELTLVSKRGINIKDAIIEFGDMGEENMKTRAGTSWSFGSVSSLDIDYNEIGRELCKANPLALIEAICKDNDTFGVMVHNTLATKAKVCELPDPNTGIGEVTMPGVGYVVRCELEDFSDWIAWAKVVKAAKWPTTYHRKAKVTVTLAKV